MSTVHQPRLITVEVFERLAGDSGAELIDGVIVERPVPDKSHQEIQHRLPDQLRCLLGKDWEVFSGLSFRPTTEYFLSRADVGAVARQRWSEVPRKGYLPGAPDLHVEVLSRDDYASAMGFKRRLSLTRGARQFWVVDPDAETVEVIVPDGFSREYRRGERISLAAFGTRELAVDAVFAEGD